MNDVVNEVDYDKISYNTIPNDNVKKGLQWLIENVKFDVLVMMHRRAAFLSFFINQA